MDLFLGEILLIQDAQAHPCGKCFYYQCLLVWAVLSSSVEPPQDISAPIQHLRLQQDVRCQLARMHGYSCKLVRSFLCHTLLMRLDCQLSTKVTGGRNLVCVQTLLQSISSLTRG